MQSKNKKVLVSVIVPAYNEERTLEKCLTSIQEQTYRNIELIVVDDGSKDGTSRIAKKYADIFLVQKHEGPGIARNKAAKIAKGEILVFIDADIYLDKDYVKDIINPILNDNAIATYTTEEYIANSKNIWSRCYTIDHDLKNNKKNVESLDQKNRFRAISKSYFLKKGGYNISLGYNDDNFLTEEIKSIFAEGAKCYHDNPDNLYDVYISSRWIGRSPMFMISIRNLLRYSIINSIRISFRKILRGAPIEFALYKIIYDFGILMGMFTKSKNNNFAK